MNLKSTLAFPILFIAQLSIASVDDNKKFISELVDQYRPEISQRYGQELRLTFEKSDILQALGGWNREGQIVINVFAKILALPQSEIAAVICHEVGHILGDVPMSRLPERNRVKGLDERNNVEGEADYFSGGCLRKLMERESNPEEAALSAVKSFYRTLYNREVQMVDDLPDYPGITPRYPDAECRLQSVYSGITSRPRPTCWYNP